MLQRLTLSDQNKFRKIIDRTTLVFIVSQPFVNLLTSVSVRLLASPVSIGMLVRAVYLVFIVGVLILFGSRRLKIITLVTTLPFLFRFVLDVLVRHESFFENVKYLTKAAFFPFCVLWFYFLFRNRKPDSRHKPFDQLLESINITILITSIVILISAITGTGIENYSEGYREGISGWFLSGNEVASFYASTLAIPIILLLKKITVMRIIAFASQALAVFLLGTKTSIVMTVLILTYLHIIVFRLAKNSRISTKAVLAVGLFLFSVFVLYSLPATNNIVRQIRHNRLMSEINKLESQEAIPSFLQKEIKNTPADDTGTALYSIHLSQQNTGDYRLSGYFYPQYLDLTTPKQAEMALVIRDRTNHSVESIGYTIKNTFNANINNPRSDKYNAYYAGISAIIPSEQFELNHQYKFYVKVKSSEINRTYEIDESRIFVTNNFDKGLKLIKNDAGINVEFMPARVKSDNKNTENKKAQIKLPKWLGFLLSNRDGRLIGFLEEHPASMGETLIFGAGYLANSDVKYGSRIIYSLELDIIESIIVFGIIGFIVIFLPFLYLLIRGLRNLYAVHWFTFLCNPYMFSVLSSIGLIMVCGFFVGHMFLSPSAALFIGATINILFAMSKNIGLNR